MRKKYDYEANILLQHDESPAKINLQTGVITQLHNQTPLKQKIKVDEDKIKFEADSIFQKSYSVSWKYLKNELTVLEYSAAHNLALEAKAFTNSLEPINDDTILEHLHLVLNVSINKVKAVVKKLFEYGVYGKFEVVEVGKGYTKFWILNPYLNFNGQYIDKGILQLFSKTKIAIAFNAEKNNKQ